MGDDWLTEHYDALGEHGLEDDPRAWESLELVRDQLSFYGRALKRPNLSGDGFTQSSDTTQTPEPKQ